MVQFEEGPLATAPLRSHEGALAMIAVPHSSDDGGRNVA